VSDELPIDQPVAVEFLDPHPLAAVQASGDAAAQDVHVGSATRLVESVEAILSGLGRLEPVVDVDPGAAIEQVRTLVAAFRAVDTSGLPPHTPPQDSTGRIGWLGRRRSSLGSL
jgi:hypothetical protein